MEEDTDITAKHPLLSVLPQDQIDKVYSDPHCEFDHIFLGFTEYYEALAPIIPKTCIVIDFGCNAAAQCYYFKDHQQYIGIDIGDEPRFSMENTIHFNASIQRFILDIFPTLNIKETQCFAICNYVPDDEAQRLVKETFTNVFNYYPDHSHLDF